MLKNDAGQVAQISFGFDNYYQCNYRIWGSRGAVFVKRAYSIPSHMAPEITLEQQDIIKTFTLPPANHFQNSLDFFAEEAGNPENYDLHYTSILEQAHIVDNIKRHFDS